MSREAEGESVVVVILAVNGRVRYATRPDIEAARKEADLWLAEARKSYPHKTFTPEFFEGRRVG